MSDVVPGLSSRIKLKLKILSVLDVVSQITTEKCRFEFVRADWPEPVEVFTPESDAAVLVCLFVRAGYELQGRIGDTGRGLGRLGATFLLPPGQAMIGRGDGGSVQLARCIFDAGLYRDVIGPRGALTDRELDRALDIRGRTLRLLVYRLCREAAQPTASSPALLDGMAKVLLIDSLRQIFSADVREALPRRRLTPGQLRAVDQRLKQPRESWPTIADLADICGYSPQYFRKLFGRSTGQRLREYMAEIRFSRAEQLLCETSLPLKEIAFQLGFSGAANFVSAFKQRAGRPPGAYRRDRA